MAAAVVQSYGQDILMSNRIGASAVNREKSDQRLPTKQSTESGTRKQFYESTEQVLSSSSYILASDVADLSGDVDRWINGSNSSSATRSAGTQGSRARAAQQSTVPPPCAANSVWYLAAMILPLFSIHNCVMTLRCTPSTVVNAAEVVIQHLNSLCSQAKAHIRRLVRDGFAREVFAATMDVILVVYALGFLFLSMFQASIIG